MFLCTEIHVFLALLMHERSYKVLLTIGTLQKLFHTKMKINTCTVCEMGLSSEEEAGQIVVLAILRMSL